MSDPKKRSDRRGGAPPDAPTTPVASVDTLAGRFAELMSSVPVGAFVKDALGRYSYVNPYLLAVMGGRAAVDVLGKTDAEIWPPDVAKVIGSHDDLVRRSGSLQVLWQVMPLADGPRSLLVLKFPQPTSDGAVELGGIAVDLSERAQTEAERDRLVAAVDQVVESVVITDLDGRITYVNPAFERVSGYSRSEVSGLNPRILKSGLQSPTFYEAMWAALTAGSSWVADFTNRRKDGSLYTEEAVISPIRDATGTVTSYVAVKRDVTRERELEQLSERSTRERALIGDTIRSLRASDAPDAAGQDICRQVLKLSGLCAAHLYIFEADGRAVPIGFVVSGEPGPVLRPLPYQRSRHLLARAKEGPWIEPWVNRPWHPYNRLLQGLDVQQAAHAPIRYDQHVIGLLVVDAAGATAKTAVTEALAAVAEFADIAGAVIGQAVTERTEYGRQRERMTTIIERRAFHPVFQPIVDLSSLATVGYEALTRFTDDVAPDVRFGAAAALGLGSDLEFATLQAAIVAAARLPPAAWLNLNVSPEFVLARKQLRTLLHGIRRHVVLEITEHAAIEDYEAFRTAIGGLGSGVELAVDDAGSGFASLRHILELRPAFVKLDRSLVADLDSDEARQAMIVGIGHFAKATGCRLIGEGVETEAELATLRDLGVPLGQGFLLARPIPI